MKHLTLMEKNSIIRYFGLLFLIVFVIIFGSIIFSFFLNKKGIENIKESEYVHLLDLSRDPLVKESLNNSNRLCIPPRFVSCGPSFDDRFKFEKEVIEYRIKEKKPFGVFEKNDNVLKITCQSSLKPAYSTEIINDVVKWKTLPKYTTSSYSVSVSDDIERVFVRCGDTVSVSVRAKQFTATTKILDKNKKLPHVLIILMDGLSRYHFVRSMPLTLKFFKERKDRLFNFTNTNSVGPNSIPHRMAMFGHLDDWKISKIPPGKSLFSRFQKFEYATLFGQTWSEKVFKSWINPVPWLYEFPQDMYIPFESKRPKFKLFWSTPEPEFIRSTFCSNTMDNKKVFHNRITNKKSGSPGLQYSSVCIGGRYHASHLFDYYENFRQKIEPERPTFANLEIFDSHEPEQMLSYIADDILVQRLHQMESKGIFNDTILFFLSDHGIHFGEWWKKNPRGRIENSAFLLNILLPQTFINKYPEVVLYLKENEDRLVTPYDLYMMLHDLPIYPNESDIGTTIKQSVSLWNDIIPDFRTCTSSGIKASNCLCVNWEEIPIRYEEKNREFGNRLSNIALEYMNKQHQEKVPGICRTMELNKLLAFAKKESTYQVTFNVVSPREELPVFEVELLELNDGEEGDVYYKVGSVMQTTRFAKYVEKCKEDLVKASFNQHYCDCVR